MFVSIQANRCELVLRMVGHEFMLKDVPSYPVPGMTNKSHENISDRIASLWMGFLNPRPHEFEAEALTICSLWLVK